MFKKSNSGTQSSLPRVSATKPHQTRAGRWTWLRLDKTIFPVEFFFCFVLTCAIMFFLSSKRPYFFVAGGCRAADYLLTYWIILSVRTAHAIAALRHIRTYIRAGVSPAHVCSFDWRRKYIRQGFSLVSVRYKYTCILRTIISRVFKWPSFRIFVSHIYHNFASFIKKHPFCAPNTQN